MARKLALSAIVDEVSKKKTKAEKIDWLKQNDSLQLRQILRLTYDQSIEFLVPDTAPPWKKNEYFDVETMLYREARRLRIFFKGGGYDDLNQLKRESLFISLLEDVDNNDAELLVKMIAQKPLKGLTEKTLKEAFPDIYETKVV
jgi:hypothetical protein